MKLHKSLILFGATALILAGCADDGAETEETAVEEPATEEVAEEEVSTESTEESTEEVEEAEEAVNSFDGKTIKTKDVTIEITDYKVLQPGEGNNFGDTPLLAFWYDTTVHEDVTENEYDPFVWIMITKAGSVAKFSDKSILV